MSLKIDTTYPPRRYICVLSGSLPDQQPNFNEHSKAIRAEVDKRYNVKRNAKTR